MTKDELVKLAEGPQPLPVRYTCEGCTHFTAKWWKDYLDNDETDSGTKARCEKVGKIIAMYWSTNQSPPAWCPVPRATTTGEAK